MRSYLKYLSILVPLAVLLSLPCATKRQLKEYIGIPSVKLAANKGESTKYCINTFVQKDQTQYTIKRLALDTPSISSNNTVLPCFSTIKRTIELGGFNDEVPILPLFLLYRKLIIYF